MELHKGGVAMKRICLSIIIICAFVVGCSTARGTFPSSSGTQVDLSKKNYRVVRANAVGESSGFRLLGIIPFASPRYTRAMTDLYSKIGMTEGKAHALVNVVQERSNLYLVLFSIPKLTVRADVIEFLDEVENK
jgi:hypothetical protein